MALLDSDKSDKSTQLVLSVDVKSLRDTRQLLEKVGLKEAEDFIKDNPHPRLWSVIHPSLYLPVYFMKEDLLTS